MATKKTTTVSKNASKKQVTNETKVMCPVCGSEFAIGEHEHTVKNVIAIGKDSGLGEVYLPVNKRGEALKAAGIDPNKYFSIQIPGGGEQLMMKTDDGRAVPVSSDDPVIKAILGGGTVPNKNLFRRWVMSQVFHGLQNRGGFTEWLRWHGYDYQWEMLVEELRVQAKLYGKDMENFNARNRWFNKKLAAVMADDYVLQLGKDANSRPTHKCKGVPYIKYDCQNIFVADIEKKLLWPMRDLLRAITMVKTPQKLYEAVRDFWKAAPKRTTNFSQCADWKDAYKGMGGYATMQNLLRFHGCAFPKDNDFYERGLSGLQMLESAAEHYRGEGWRLFGLMKQMIDENGIDIEAKMRQWAAAKEAKGLRR
ncbi:MAG: ubiquitin carboxyl-hydrolase [Prevotella sp.]|nr:ubiquitin carboxyl-hydrolase [Prevotella sp.]